VRIRWIGKEPLDRRSNANVNSEVDRPLAKKDADVSFLRQLTIESRKSNGSTQS